MNTFASIGTLLFAMAMGAAGRRSAGGGLSHHFGDIGGTQVARLAQGCLMGIAFLVLSLVGGAALAWPAIAGTLAVILAVTAGATWGFPRYSLSFPFIHFKESDMIPNDWVEVVGLGVNGVIASAPLALVLWWIGFSPIYVLALGGLRGVAMMAAMAWTPRIRWLETEEWDEASKTWNIQPTALAEVYAGALMGLGLWLTV